MHSTCSRVPAHEVFRLYMWVEVAPYCSEVELQPLSLSFKSLDVPSIRDPSPDLDPTHLNIQMLKQGNVFQSQLPGPPSAFHTLLLLQGAAC